MHYLLILLLIYLCVGVFLVLIDGKNKLKLPQYHTVTLGELIFFFISGICVKIPFWPWYYGNDILNIKVINKKSFPNKFGSHMGRNN